MKPVLALAARVLLGLLLAIGILSAMQRGLSVTSADPGALDREQVEQIAAMTGLEPGSAEHARLSREIPLSAANLNERPGATLWHVVPGAVFFLLVALQFSRRLRARHPAWHRWNGRVMLAMVAISAVAGIYLGLARPYGGALESAAATLFGGYFLVCAARGFRAIRRREVARHREWMIRMFAIAIGISVIRVLGVANAVVFGTEGITATGFALSLWIGWILSIAAGEFWIRGSRPARPMESDEALQPL